MATRTFQSFASKVSPYAVGCPQPLLIEAIRSAAIRVCERSLLWRYEQPKFDLQPGVFEYFFDKPADTDVHVVIAAMCNDRPLEPLTLEQALEAYPEWADIYSGESAETLWGDTAPGSLNTEALNEGVLNGGAEFSLPEAVVADGSSPQVICHVSPDRYVVLPMPDDETYTMRMFYVLKPSRSATGMDSTVLGELEETIRHAALQQLLVMPNTAWSNRDLAGYHAKQATFLMAERRARANLSNSRGALRVQVPPI